MKLYVVRNKQGKFFRAVGMGGYGKNWEDSLDKAKFYAKIGQAKSRVTYFFKSDPSFGCPDILEFELDIQRAKVLDMAELTTKSIQKIEKKKINRELYWREQEKKCLTEEQERIRLRLKSL
jgi:hypothetical protein